MKKILVLGGTGVMGQHLINFLSTRDEIFVTSRQPRRSIKDNVKYILGNAHDFNFLTDILQRKYDVIVDFMSYSTEEFEKRISLMLNSTWQYFFISSSRVYAESCKPLTENSPRILDVCTDKEFLKCDDYTLSKARQENLLFSSRKTNWTIVRPYITYGENRFQLGTSEKEIWLFRAIHGKKIVFSRDFLTKSTTLTYGGDVSKLISLLISQPFALGEVYNLTSNESLSWANVLECYLNCIEAKTANRPKVLLIDHWVPSQGGNNVMSVWDRNYNRLFDNTKVTNATGYKTFRGTRTGLHDCLDKFLDNPLFCGINWVGMAQLDMLTGEWENPSTISGVKNKIKYSLVRSGITKR